jgi:nucleoside-diphosphate-sugar epimerase
MKVILTGSTGFIGGEVLKQCLSNPQIDSLVVLSRRDLPHLNSKPKAKVIIIKDFIQYSSDAVNEFEDSDACIWYYLFHQPHPCSVLPTNYLQVPGRF